MLSLIQITATIVALFGVGETEEETPVGLSYADSIPKRERTQINESFDEALVKACTPPPCTGNCRPHAATVGLEVSGGSRNYTLRWVVTDPRLDAPLIRESTCELCGLSEVGEQFVTDLDALCTRLEALEGGPGRVNINSDPEGAHVIIDGRRRGRTPWTGDLAAGEHRLRLRARGHGAQSRMLVVTSGVESSEHIELLPATGDGLRPIWPAWTSLGVGFALSIAGTALIAVHGKEWQARCTGENIDANGHCKFVYATRPLGIGLVAVGAAAIGAGAGLVVWAERDGGRLSSLGVGLRGRF